MATIHQQIDVDAEPPLVRSAWDRFIQWGRTGPGRLVCDELACVDAVRAGLIEFVPAAGGRTTVIARLEEVTEGGGSSEGLKERLGHDLVAFKDYVERSGLVERAKLSDTDGSALEHESKRKGDVPRHVTLSTEEDTTFWRSHFPT